MNQTDTTSQGQKRRICKVAIASAALGVLAFLAVYFQSLVLYPSSVRTLIWNIMGLLGLCGLVLAVVAIERIIRHKQLFKGISLAILGIVLSAYICHIWLLSRLIKPSTAPWLPSAFTLNRLGHALHLYAAAYDQFPEPNQWCDSLLRHGKVGVEHFGWPSLVVRWPFAKAKMFVWPVPKRGVCHFGMNPNCKPDSPPDTVLLFETKVGWNQFGGPEILTTERHNGDLCIILYADCGVRVESVEGVAKLKWKVEEGK